MVDPAPGRMQEFVRGYQQNERLMMSDNPVTRLLEEVCLESRLGSLLRELY